MPALALTDSHGLTGAIEFYDACRVAGVRPILGLELMVTPPAGWLGGQPGVLVLLAQSLAGWASLCRLSTAALTTPERDPTRGLAFDLLAGDAGGLLCLTGGSRGLANLLMAAQDQAAALRWLGALRDVFGDRLYAELAPGWEVGGQSADELCGALAVLAVLCADAPRLYCSIGSRTRLTRPEPRAAAVLSGGEDTPDRSSYTDLLVTSAVQDAAIWPHAVAGEPTDATSTRLSATSTPAGLMAR